MNEQQILEGKRFIGRLVEKYGIRMDEQDPAFCVVLLNRYVLEEAVSNIVEKVQRAGVDFERAAERVQQRAGRLLAQEMKPVTVVVSKTGTDWLLPGILAALVMFGAGILIGLAMKW